MSRYRPEEESKPPWLADGLGDIEWMRDWVCSRLDDLEDYQPMSQDRVENQRRIDALVDGMMENLSLGGAMKAAEHGDVEPLRRRYPEIRRFINLPELDGQGRRWPAKPSTGTRLDFALEDVERIRALWKKHYNKSRRPSGQISAIEIAAFRWDVDFDQLAERVRRG